MPTPKQALAQHHRFRDFAHEARVKAARQATGRPIDMPPIAWPWLRNLAQGAA